MSPGYHQWLVLNDSVNSTIDAVAHARVYRAVPPRTHIVFQVRCCEVRKILSYLSGNVLLGCNCVCELNWKLRIR